MVISASMDRYMHTGWGADYQSLPALDIWSLAAVARGARVDALARCAFGQSEAEANVDP